MLILSRSDVAALLSIETARQVVRQAVAEYSSGRTIVPERVRLVTKGPVGEILIMPGYVPALDAIGVKVWSQFRREPNPRLSSSSAVLLFRDPVTGLEAFMDAGWLTDIRTGATTAVACEYLAVPAARRLAVIGAGTQARSQLDAVLAAMPVEEAMVWAPTADRLERFVADAGDRHPTVQIRRAKSAQESVIGADIIVAATTSSRPVVDDEWVKPGSLVCGIGSHTPDSTEIDPRTVMRAQRVVVDTRAGALWGSGDIGGPVSAGDVSEESVVELGELVLGSARGRESSDEIAIFKSVGFAALDITAARFIVSEAISRGIGLDVALR